MSVESSSDAIARPPVPNDPRVDVSLNRIFQAVVMVVCVGVAGWFVTIDRQVQKIGQQLEFLTIRLQVLEEVQRELRDLSSRVQYIENTRYTKADAQACERKFESLDSRVSALESNRERGRR